MIDLFVNSFTSAIPSVLAFIAPWFQYMLTNPLLGFCFIVFVIYGFVHIFLQIKNIFNGGLRP